MQVMSVLNTAIKYYDNVHDESGVVHTYSETGLIGLKRRYTAIAIYCNEVKLIHFQVISS